MTGKAHEGFVSMLAETCFKISAPLVNPLLFPAVKGSAVSRQCSSYKVNLEMTFTQHNSKLCDKNMSVFVDC